MTNSMNTNLDESDLRPFLPLIAIAKLLADGMYALRDTREVSELVGKTYIHSKMETCEVRVVVTTSALYAAGLVMIDLAFEFKPGSDHFLAYVKNALTQFSECVGKNLVGEASDSEAAWMVKGSPSITDSVLALTLSKPILKG